MDPSQVDCRSTLSLYGSFLSGLSIAIPPKAHQFLQILSKPLQILPEWTVNWLLPPQGSTLSEVILLSLHRSFPSWLSIDPKPLQILPGWTIDHHPPGLNNFGRFSLSLHRSSISLHRSFPSGLLIDPTPINILRGNPSKIFVDPSQVDCQSTPTPLLSPPLPHLQISTSLQILPKLTVNQPPSPPLPPSPPTNFNLSADPLWVDCQSTPLPSLPTYKFQPLCRSSLSWLLIDSLLPSLPTYKWQPPSSLSIVLPPVLIRGRSTGFEQNSSHSNQTTRLASQRAFP